MFVTASTTRSSAANFGSNAVPGEVLRRRKGISVLVSVAWYDVTCST